MTKSDAVKLRATEMLRVTTEEAKCVKFKSQHKYVYVKQYVSASKLFKTTALYMLHSDCKCWGEEILKVKWLNLLDGMPYAANRAQS
jgi:hypothetical protein